MPAMAASASADTALDLACGCAGPLSVSLRRKGDGIELFALDRPTLPSAAAVDDDASAFVYWAPRRGVERYSDWSAFEQSCRTRGRGHSRVWRIAENDERVCFLGQLTSSPGPRLPMAAALWRGWLRPWLARSRGLVWQGPEATHLWITDPGRFPRHARIAGRLECEAVLLELGPLVTRRDFTLDVGGIPPALEGELGERLTGLVLPVEPFAQLLVPGPLRESLAAHSDTAAYLPAVGAAIALLDGPPVPLSPCASYPEAAAGAS